jgi:hypothetical protein
LSCALPKHHAMKAYQGSGGIAARILWPRHYMEVSGQLTHRERAHGDHWIGGCVGPRAVLDAVVKRKIPSPRQESNPKTLIVQPVAQRYTNWAITILVFENNIFQVVSTFYAVLHMSWQRGHMLQYVGMASIHCQYTVLILKVRSADHAIVGTRGTGRLCLWISLQSCWNQTGGWP